MPAGAKRVDLAGKAIMPMIIDTHVHLSDTRNALIWDLRLRAYYGVSAALSLGTDVYEFLEYTPDDSGCRAVSQCTAQHHDARTGRTTVP